LPRSRMSFYIGASTPALQGRPADHVSSSDAQQQTGDCALCHNTTDWKSNTLPIGHMPNPASQPVRSAIRDQRHVRELCDDGRVAALHTGITGNCGQCHGSPSGALTFYNNNDNPLAAVLTPRIFRIYRHRLQLLSRVELRHRRLRPDVDERGQARLRAHGLQHLPRGEPVVLHGRVDPGVAGPPASHQSSSNPQEVSGDCSGCHSTTDWNTTAKPPNHMPTPGTQTCSVCHTAIGSTEASYARWPRSACCTRDHHGHLRPVPRKLFRGIDLVQQLHTEAAFGLSPSHIPYLVGTDCSPATRRTMPRAASAPRT